MSSLIRIKKIQQRKKSRQEKKRKFLEKKVRQKQREAKAKKIQMMGREILGFNKMRLKPRILNSINPCLESPMDWNSYWNEYDIKS